MTHPDAPEDRAAPEGCEWCGESQATRCAFADCPQPAPRPAPRADLREDLRHEAHVLDRIADGSMALTRLPVAADLLREAASALEEAEATERAEAYKDALEDILGTARILAEREDRYGNWRWVVGQINRALSHNGGTDGA